MEGKNEIKKHELVSPKLVHGSPSRIPLPVYGVTKSTSSLSVVSSGPNTPTATPSRIPTLSAKISPKHRSSGSTIPKTHSPSRRSLSSLPTPSPKHNNRIQSRSWISSNEENNSDGCSVIPDSMSEYESKDIPTFPGYSSHRQHYFIDTDSVPESVVSSTITTDGSVIQSSALIKDFNEDDLCTKLVSSSNVLYPHSQSMEHERNSNQSVDANGHHPPSRSDSIESNPDQSETSTLSFSQISIPSKVSLLSGKGGDFNLPVSCVEKSWKSLVSSSVVGPQDSDDAYKMKLLLSEQTSELFQMKMKTLEKDKDMIMKELRESQTTAEFLENENNTLTERASKAEVQVSTLELRVEQLEEQTNRLSHQSTVEDGKVDGAVKEEREHLRKQLSEVIKQKEEIADKLLTLEKEHMLCNRQILMASSLKTDTEKQLITITTELHANQEKVKHFQEALRKSEEEKDQSKRSLELEKCRVHDIQKSLDSIGVTLETTTNELKKLHNEKEETNLLMSKKQQKIGELEEELKQRNKESLTLSSGLQSLKVKMKLVSDELESAKKVLLETRQEQKESEIKARKLVQKLSQVECELKEKEDICHTETNEKEQISAELHLLRKTSQELEELLASKTVALSQLEKDMASIKIEKQAVEALVAAKENDLKNSLIAKDQELLDLTSEVKQLKAENKQMLEYLAEKEEIVKNLTIQKTALECSIESEREQKSKLDVQVTNLKEELLSLQGQYQQLKTHNQKMTAVTSKKTQTSQELESSLRQQLQDKEEELRVKESKLHSTDHDIQLKLKETELERANSKATEVQAQIALLSSDVENYKKLSDSFQAKLQLLQNSKHQELLELKSQLESKRSDITKLNTKLASLQSEIMRYEEMVKKSNDDLDGEKKVLAELQMQLSASETNGISVRSHLSVLEEHIKTLDAKTESQKKELLEAEKQKQVQSEQLKITEARLNKMDKERKEEMTRFTEMMATMSIQNKEELERIKREKDMLQLTCEKLQQTLSSSQEQLDNSQRDLLTTCTELSKMEAECKKLFISIQDEVSSGEVLAKTLSTIQSEYDNTCEQLKSLENQLKVRNDELDQLKTRYKEAQDHCSTLQQELKLKGEVSAATEKRLNEKHSETIEEFNKKINQFRNRLEKSDLNMQELNGELSQAKFEYTSICSQMSTSHDTTQQLRSQLAEEKAILSVTQQKVAHLESALAKEKDLKIAAQEQLSHELSKHHDLEMKLDDVKENFSRVSISKESLEALLEEEKSKVLFMKDQIKDMEDEIAEIKSALMKEKNTQEAMKLKAERELLALKCKYLGEKKALNEKKTEMQAKIHLLQTNCDSKADVITKIKKECENLEHTKDTLQIQLSETQRNLKEKKESLKTSEVRNQSLEVQLAQLQLEVSTLSKTQLEYQEFKKNVESASREELQRVLSEVTQHMEQQYSAHYYLEKMRIENEAMALKEKDRQIGHLKSELKQKKMEMKQDKLHIESLELEVKYLKSRQKDNERSRQKIATRLGKIDDILTVSTSSSSFHTPRYSSTPLTAGSKSLK